MGDAEPDHDEAAPRESGSRSAESTVHLGQYVDDNAHAIMDALREAGIEHWAKVTGRFARAFFGGDWGTHVFVDEARLGEARAIADRIAPGAR